MKRARRAAFEDLVREHHLAVYRTALRIVRSEADAQDVTQQVFLSVLEGRSQAARSDEVGRSLRWLATRTALSHLRGARNRRARENRCAVKNEAHDEEHHPEGEERVSALRRMLDRLPEELRTAVVLRFQEGLTYGRIAAALDCSEPTASDRVQRGLDRLRGQLTRAGLPGLVPDLTDLLATEEGRTPPAGLEQSLLTLERASAGAGLLGAPWLGAAAVGLLVAGIAIAAVWIGGGADPPTAPTASPREDGAAAPTVLTGELAGDPDPGDRAAAAPLETDHGAVVTPTAEPAPPPTGTIIGRILHVDGHPVGGVAVTALSVQRSGKVPRFSPSTATDFAGRFRIDAPVDLEDGQDYRIRARHPDLVGHTGEAFRLGAGRVEVRGDLLLHPNSEDRPGSYALECIVTGPAGLPLEGTPVRVFRRTKNARGEWTRALEAGELTDAGGAVRLEGSRLGEKLLVVEGGEAGLRSFEEALPISTGGLVERRIELLPGLRLAGRARDVDGDAPAGLDLFLIRGEGGKWVRTPLATDGSFEFEGLDEGDFELHVLESGWSDPALVEVRSGREDVELLLKRRDDPRDRGMHLGELHGSIFDAATGEELELARRHVEAVAVGTSDPSVLRRDLFPLMLHPTPPQVIEPDEPRRGFHLTGLDAGSWIVAVRQPGYAPAFAGPWNLGERGLQGGLRVELHRPASVCGAVVDPEGRPVEGAVVFAAGSGAAAREETALRDRHLRAEGRHPRGLWQGVAETGPEGLFELQGIHPDLPLRLVVLHPHHEPAFAPMPELAPESSATGLRLVAGAARER